MPLRRTASGFQAAGPSAPCAGAACRLGRVLGAEAISWRPRQHIEPGAQQRRGSAVMILRERSADRFDIGAGLKCKRRDDRRITRDGLDRRAGLVRAQKNLGYTAVAVNPAQSVKRRPACSNSKLSFRRQLGKRSRLIGHPPLPGGHRSPQSVPRAAGTRSRPRGDSGPRCGFRARRWRRQQGQCRRLRATP